jgi:hypothetical protein
VALCPINPERADKFPSAEFVDVIIHGFGPGFIHGNTVKVDDSKLSLTLPTLNEKSLFTTKGLQFRVDVSEI